MGGTRIQEVNGGRSFIIDNSSKGVATSVFMVEVGGLGLVLEFDRASVVAHVKQTYDLHENWDAGLSKLLAA